MPDAQETTGSVKPIRIYRSDRGIWHAEVEHGGLSRNFSLHTRDEAEALIKWRKYIRLLELGNA